MFAMANAPPDVFPTESWANTPGKGAPPTDLRSQFGTIRTSGDANSVTIQQQSLRTAFLQINQSWLLKDRHLDSINQTDPQLFTMQTPAEKFHALTTNHHGVGALAIVHWVTSISDGGEPEYSKPLAIILGPLIAAPQDGNTIGYKLEDLGLSFDQPAQPLGKDWSSKRIYPLITLLFRNT